jgi:hypothetical protein
MRLSKMWGDFELAIMQAPANLVKEILYSAALKKKSEIEIEEDKELEDSFINMLIKNACKGRRSPYEQLKYIKTYSFYSDE